MNIFFIGTVQFSYDTLKTLLESGVNIVGVATKEASAFNADFKDLRPLCEQYKIPYKTVRDINHENNVAFIKTTNPDVIYCFGWSSLLGKELLAIPPKGVIGFHPAKLPFNRGRHPIIWALCLGLKETASTFFFMDEGADTGDILSQELIQITDADTAETLYWKITTIAIKQVLIFTNELRSGMYNRLKQDPFEGNHWRKRSKKDGEIDFRMSSYAIYNLVRALTRPYVGAHINHNDQDIKVWSVEQVDYSCINIEPGKVIDILDNTFTVKTMDGAIRIIIHEFENIPNTGTYL